MLSLVPDLQIIDITHDLPPHDVRAGALTLVRAAQYLPDRGIVLGVVDPGVGTDRRLVAVEVEQGTLLGPDNRLLAPALALPCGAPRGVSPSNTPPHPPAPGPTLPRPRPAPDAPSGRPPPPPSPLASMLASSATTSTPPVWSPASSRCRATTRVAPSTARCGGSTVSATAS